MTLNDEIKSLHLHPPPVPGGQICFMLDWASFRRPQMAPGPHPGPFWVIWEPYNATVIWTLALNKFTSDENRTIGSQFVAKTHQLTAVNWHGLTGKSSKSPTNITLNPSPQSSSQPSPSTSLISTTFCTSHCLESRFACGKVDRKSWDVGLQL